MTFNSKLISLLKTDKRFIDDDGELLIAAVQDQAWKINRDLVKLLLLDKEIKAKFFEEIDAHWIFNVNTFIDYISQKNFFDDSYTRFKNKIGLIIGDKFLQERGEVSLAWPYKDCVLEGGQTKEEEKRHEIFFNDVLAHDEINRLLDPKVLTNLSRYTINGKQTLKNIRRDESGIIRENLIIKGNNLIALHSILAQFRERVKLIYIDPPYNLGGDSFGYNDNFNHSSWLTFMKNRLQVAKDLLSPDGVIFIQINDVEQGHLKVLCDEIFGRASFHTTICVQMSHLSGVKMAHKEKKLPKIKEFILFYSKSERIKLIPQYVPASWDQALERYTSFVKRNGYSDEDCSKWEVIPLGRAIKEAGINEKDSKEVLEFKLKNAGAIFRTAMHRGADYSAYPQNNFARIVNNDGSYYFIYKGEDVSFSAEKVIEINGVLTPVVALGDIWTDIGINNLSNEGGVDFRFGKKPEKLIERIIKMISDNPEDILLDFFAGSGTLGAVAHKLGRQYILIEQLDVHIEKTVNRLQNVLNGEKNGVSKDNKWKGGGSFVFAELMRYNEAFIQDIKRAKSGKELLKIWQEMEANSFLKWYVNPKSPEDAKNDFEALGKIENGLEKQKHTLLELLDKNQLYVNLSEINDKQFKVTKEDKELNKLFYIDEYSV